MNWVRFFFFSQSQAEAHYKGSRHAKKIKSQESKAKAKLPVPAESGGSRSSPAGPPLPARDNGSQHAGSVSLLKLCWLLPVIFRGHLHFLI